MKKIYTYTILVLAVFGLSACSGAVQHMKVAPAGATIEQAPKDKAQIVFLRPSSFGALRQSSVYDIDIKTQTRKIIGILPARAKIIYQVEPGEHLFMLFGLGRTRLMSATLEAGKTYYVLAEIKMGFWSSDFVLNPVHKDEVSDKELQSLLDSCKLIEISEETHQWANEKKAEMTRRYKAAYKHWMSKAIEDRPKLKIEDGR